MVALSRTAAGGERPSRGFRGQRSAIVVSSSQPEAPGHYADCLDPGRLVAGLVTNAVMVALWPLPQLPTPDRASRSTLRSS